MTSTELERVEPAALGPLEPDSPEAAWKMAETLASSLFARSMNSPADVFAAILAGAAMGMPAIEAVRSFHIIQGEPSLKPEKMLALVRSRGHSVVIEHHDDGQGATVTGTRRDTGDTMTTTFTMADAKRAGLGGKANDSWAKWPQQMCQWRAVANLVRALFGDVLSGYYTPDELTGGGALPDALPAPPPPPPSKRKPRAKAKPVAEVVDAEVVEFDRAAAKQALVAAYRGVYDATDGCDRDATADAAEHWQAHAAEHGEPVDDDTMNALLADALTAARANTLADGDATLLPDDEASE